MLSGQFLFRRPKEKLQGKYDKNLSVPAVCMCYHFGTLISLTDCRTLYRKGKSSYAHSPRRTSRGSRAPEALWGNGAGCILAGGRACPARAQGGLLCKGGVQHESGAHHLCTAESKACRDSRPSGQYPRHAVRGEAPRR